MLIFKFGFNPDTSEQTSGLCKQYFTKSRVYPFVTEFIILKDSSHITDQRQPRGIGFC